MSELTIASEVSGVVADCVKAGGRGWSEVTQDFRMKQDFKVTKNPDTGHELFCFFFSFPSSSIFHDSFSTPLERLWKLRHFRIAGHRRCECRWSEDPSGCDGQVHDHSQGEKPGRFFGYPWNWGCKLVTGVIAHVYIYVCIYIYVYI